MAGPLPHTALKPGSSDGKAPGMKTHPVNQNISTCFIINDMMAFHANMQIY